MPCCLYNDLHNPLTWNNLKECSKFRKEDGKMRLTANIRTLSRMLDHYSHFNPSPLSVKQFIDFGKKKTSTVCRYSILLFDLHFALRSAVGVHCLPIRTVDLSLGVDIYWISASRQGARSSFDLLFVYQVLRFLSSCLWVCWSVKISWKTTTGSKENRVNFFWKGAKNHPASADVGFFGWG